MSHTPVFHRLIHRLLVFWRWPVVEMDLVPRTCPVDLETLRYGAYLGEGKYPVRLLMENDVKGVTVLVARLTRWQRRKRAFAGHKSQKKPSLLRAGAPG